MLLEAAPGSSREYLLLATGRLAKLERELSEAADKGFRLLPNGILRNPNVHTEEGVEIVLLLERTAGTTQRYAYRLAAASSDYEYVLGTSDVLTGTIEKEPLQAALRVLVREGYDVVGLASRSVDVKRRGALFGLGSERVRRVQHVLIGERSPERQPLTAAQEAEPAWREKYRLIAREPGPGLQEELSQAASAGYRLLLASPDAFPELVIVMEKTADPAGSNEYLLLGSGDVASLKEQMKTAAARGFRAHRRGIFREPLIVIMERRPGQQVEHDYSLVERSGTGKLKKQLLESAANGYLVAGVGTGVEVFYQHDGRSVSRHRHLVVMEKGVGPLAAPGPDATPTPDPSRHTLTLGATKPSSMEKRLNETAAQGYRITAASDFASLSFPGFVTDKLSFIVEKAAEPPATFEYRVLSAVRVSTMQKELNQAGAQGFRVVPYAILAKTARWGGDELLAVVEKAPGSAASYQYLVLSTKRKSTLEKEIEQARAEGWEVIGQIYRAGDHVAFLESSMQAKETT